VGTFAAILLALGGFLFLSIVRQTEADLTRSLRAAAHELEHAAETREREAIVTGGAAVDAVDELRIPDRSLYLLDTAGMPQHPWAAPAVIRAAAVQAARTGPMDRHVKVAGGPRLQLFAEPFTLPSGHRYVAVVAANRIELEDRYAAVIVLFSALALTGVLLVAIGGWLLARKAVRPVEKSVEQMRRFMADAAHELRTPIAVLRGRTEVALQRERDVTAYIATLQTVGLEAERMGGIVEDLLTLARADAGERPLRQETLFLDDIALDASGAMSALAAERGVTFGVERFEEAPVVGDPVLLRQLILIVLDNALKFTPAGGSVRLRVGREDSRATIAVEDTGIGIADDEIPRIFDRFYRGASAREQAGGVGLGLSIALWIADAHGATIDVTSPHDRGTTVTLVFPAPPMRG
jgi:signal transduction histidine kinase